MVVALSVVVLLAAWIDLRERRRAGAHRRRTSMALWLALDERSSAMRAGEHVLDGQYLPDTVPWRSGRGAHRRSS
jgi:hypothetical protein